MNINYWNHIESMEPNKYSQKTSCHFLTSLTLGQYCNHIYYTCVYIYIYIITQINLTTLISGWWFQTFFLFQNIWDNPSH